MIEQTEKQKYVDLWKRGDYTSRSAVPFAHFLNKWVFGDCIEIGAGNGTTAKIVHTFPGVKMVIATDITVNQIPAGVSCIECPAWEIPIDDKQFDFSFSTDVLEHIPPEKVVDVLKELDRITKNRTIHQIATFNMGNEHLTVKPIDWWRAQFAKHTSIDFEIIERTN